jgi:hypothetical protein
MGNENFPGGAVAKWQGNGLQNHHRRFDSASRLHPLFGPEARKRLSGSPAPQKMMEFHRNFRGFPPFFWSDSPVPVQWYRRPILASASAC